MANVSTVSTATLISKNLLSIAHKALRTGMPSPTLAKVDDRVSGAAQQAVQSLLKHKRCAAFVYEVDPEELGLVNYFEIVTQPMHLDLVRKKLQVTLVARIPRV